MMPVVRINDATFLDLSTLKTWFGTKSPSETIDRIVREMMEELGIEREDEAEGASGTPSVAENAQVFNSAPSLAFTKPMKATINSKPLLNPNWASILHEMLVLLKSKGLSGEKFVQELGIPARARLYEAEGYRYFADLGISVQGQSANDAWKEVDRIAKKWRIPVSVEFVWRQNPKAQSPGKSGVLRSGKA